MANDRDEQREAEVHFSNLLREKVKSARPSFEELLDRPEAKPESEEEEQERE